MKSLGVDVYTAGVHRTDTFIYLFIYLFIYFFCLTITHYIHHELMRDAFYVRCNAFEQKKKKKRKDA